MYPVLVVEGVAYNVESIDFLENKPAAVKVSIGGMSHTFFNAKVRLTPNGIDFDKHLVWRSQYDIISDALQKRIEAHEERMIELAVDAMENDLPFTDNRGEYMSLKDHVEGLHEALGIVSQGGYMEEDVDLSGGEKI